jgi:hypothetical protein
VPGSRRGAGQATEALLDDEEEPEADVLLEVDGLLLSVDLVSEVLLLGAGVLLDEEPRLSVR